MSKAPSPAQLAARAKFAAAAKAGKFKRKTGAAKARKRNPVGPKQGDAPEYFARVKGRGWVREFARNAPVHMWRYAKDFADAQIWSEGQAVQIKTMCDACSAACELVNVADNPLTRVKVKSPSMATGKAPTKRLTKRRKATNKAPAGYYANPVQNQLFAVKVNAGNDRNGNSRRGWIVWEVLDKVEPRAIGFVDEDYGGSASLTRAYGDIPAVGMFDISARDYANFKRQGPVWINTGRYLK